MRSREDDLILYGMPGRVFVDDMFQSDSAIPRSGVFQVIPAVHGIPLLNLKPTWELVPDSKKQDGPASRFLAGMTEISERWSFIGQSCRRSPLLHHRRRAKVGGDVAMVENTSGIVSTAR